MYDAYHVRVVRFGAGTDSRFELRRHMRSSVVRAWLFATSCDREAGHPLTPRRRSCVAPPRDFRARGVDPSTDRDRRFSCFRVTGCTTRSIEDVFHRTKAPEIAFTSSRWERSLSAIFPCGSIHGANVRFPRPRLRAQFEKSAAVPDARHLTAPRMARVRLATSARARWVARSRDFAAAIRARRLFARRGFIPCASPSVRRSGFPRRCTSRAIRRRPTSAANIVRGHEPSKASTSRTSSARGRATEPQRTVKCVAECRGAPRHRASEPRDVSAHVLEDASRDFSRAMESEIVVWTRNSTHFCGSNRAPLGLPSTPLVVAS